MKSTNSYCRLCLDSKPLEMSHIIPSFVFKWLKRTSATGYFRDHRSPNLRRQDGLKYKLLCSDCENLFNKFETLFSKNIFHPYVSEELDNYGVAQSKIKYFDYGDWLLRFIISVHWRTCISSTLTKSDLGEKLSTIRASQIEIWRQFLIGNRDNTGNNESYIVFLQNLAAGYGSFPDNINEKINHYLLRAVDSTTAFTKNKIAIYTKLGPFVFFTTLKPNKMKEVTDIRVRLKGRIKTAQHLNNSDIANFIFIDRPNEVYENYLISKKQQKIISEQIKKNPNRVINSLTIGALEGDIQLRKRNIAKKK
ncbi:MAG TPA: hypothetical protein ENI76_06655 [Ignavibacteria bacterium]|nr:hypothetical protein [Ignavibacteria bacterium]